jgi:nucleoside phosphorylase/CheY-like chemotaxis protein
MLDILIIEDDSVKLKKIANAISSVDGINVANIESVTDAHGAKKLLRKKCFDLLILDIAIPPRIDRDVQAYGGLILLEEIIKRDIYKVPTHIVGVTKYPDIYKKVESKFKRELLSILLYDHTSDEILDQVRSKVGIIVCSKIRAYNVPKEYGSHLSIICALERPELKALLRNGWNWEEITYPIDEITYYQAKLEDEDRVRIIHAASIPKVGMTAAAILASKMISIFRPKYLAMCGITAGHPDTTRIGDVIVADPVWDWGSGKWVEKNGYLMFLKEPHHIPLDVGIRNKFKKMASNETLLFKIRNSFEGDTPDYDLSLKIGPLASGASVLADGKIREQIREQHRKLLGIEMEAYAIHAVANEAMNPKPIAFSIKSVVDFADSTKKDKFQRFGAFTSAQVLKHFVESYL